MTAAVLHSPQGDDLRLAERLIVAPVAGVFRPHPPKVVTTEGEIVQDGQSIGVVDGPGQSVEVLSFFTGYLMGMLAEAGQRVRPGQPVAWLRSVNGEPAPWR